MTSQTLRTGTLLAPSGALVVTVWFGLTAGVLQVIGVLIAQAGFGKIAGLGLDMVWMTPLATALLYGTVGVALGLIGLLWPAAQSPTMVIGVGAALLGLDLVLFIPRMHTVSELLLAAGIGTTTARVLTSPERFIRVVRHSLPGLVAAIALAGLLVRGGRAVAERRAIANLSAPAADYNVLLLVLDTVRGLNLSLYGYPRPTSPSLERWAARGVRFDRALVTSSWTLPSHGSMFTGRFPHELSFADDRPLETPSATLAEVLRSRGYATAGFVANLSYAAREYGLARGFLHYRDFPVSWEELLVSSRLGREIANNRMIRRVVGYYDFLGRKPADQVNAEFLEWLSRNGERPFFAFLNYFDAHGPYLPPPDIERRFASVSRKLHLLEHRLHHSERSDTPPMTPAEIRREMDAYDAAISYLDAEVGQLLDTLEQSGVLARTLVIITSDHGEHFGEHGKLTHGGTLYRAVLQVPLVLVFPAQVPAGVVVSEPVSLRDLPATVVDLIGLSEGQVFPGTSLAQFWDTTSASSPRGPVISQLDRRGRRWIALTQGAIHYVRHPGRGDEMYDWDHDPQEQRNLAADPRYGAHLDVLKQRAESVLALWGRKP